MNKNEIRAEFEKNGLGISTQAIEIISKMGNINEVVLDVIAQAKVRRLVIAGGDIIKYQIKGVIANNIASSGDI